MTSQPAPDPTALPRRTVTAMALAGLVTAAVPAAPAAATPNPARTTAAGAPAAPKPTIVLVHGAFADAAGWAGVVKRLQARGYTVIAPANPLRGVDGDSAYLRSVLATLPGPLVLVGHC
ncbi:MAG: hypothetical protein ACKVZ6_18230 [Kineosporiaceae bacterium]|jgi:pimeloyl-ACP methyl ester carboxylesterase